MTDFESVLKNAKTFLELQIAYRNLTDGISIFDNKEFVQKVEVEKLKTTLQELLIMMPNPRDEKYFAFDGQFRRFEFIPELITWKKTVEKLLGCVETKKK